MTKDTRSFGYVCPCGNSMTHVFFSYFDCLLHPLGAYVSPRILKVSPGPNKAEVYTVSWAIKADSGRRSFWVIPRPNHMCGHPALRRGSEPFPFLLNLFSFSGTSESGERFQGNPPVNCERVLKGKPSDP